MICRRFADLVFPRSVIGGLIVSFVGFMNFDVDWNWKFGIGIGIISVLGDFDEFKTLFPLVFLISRIYTKKGESGKKIIGRKERKKHKYAEEWGCF